jgi:hypothetical protein
MIDKLSGIKQELLITTGNVDDNGKALITSDDAYLITLKSIGNLSEAILMKSLNKSYFESTLKSLMLLDYLCDKHMSIEAINYQIEKSENYEPRFNMICFIVDKVNEVGKHDASGLHGIVYAYLTQCANHFGFKLKDCI